MAQQEHTGGVQAPGAVCNPLTPTSKVLLAPSPHPQPPRATPINLCDGVIKRRGDRGIQMHQQLI